MRTTSAVLLAVLLGGGCYADHGYAGADSGVTLDVDGGPRIELSIADTLGWTMTLSYSPSPPHLPTSETGLPHEFACPEGERSGGAIDWNGRLLVIQARCDNRMQAIMQRPVVCEATRDCEPVIPFLRSVGFDPDEIPSLIECVHGLCQFPDEAFSHQDLYALCLADTRRWPDFDTARSVESGYHRLRLLIAEHCFEGTCTSVPETCRQP